MSRNFTGDVIFDTLRQNKGLTLGLAGAVLAVAGLALAPPQLLRLLIDRHLVPGRSEGIVWLALAYTLTLLLSGAAGFLKGALLTACGQKIIRGLRQRMMEKLSRVKATYFTQNPTGVTASRFIADVENVNTLFSDGLVSMLVDCLKIIGIAVSIFCFSFRLGLLTLLLIPAVFGVSRFFRSRMLKAQTANLEQVGLVNNQLDESVKNAAMIKVFHKEAYMEERFGLALEENFRTKERVNLYSSCYAPVIQLLRSAAIVLVVLLSSSQMNLLGMSLGMAAAAIDLITGLLGPIESLGTELQSLQKGISGIRRLNAFWREEEEAPKAEGFRWREFFAAGPGEIRFEDLSFAYEADHPVLRNIDLVIRKGESVTITGRTGVGKTTMFNLIMGLLEPSRGRLLINGVDACRIPNREKRRLFGYVEQDFQFVSGSVARQVSLGDPEISPRKIREVCEFVGLRQYIEELPEGFDTVTGDGSEFSWGQRQLLAIARALAADPAILLLDEITANLDSGTEEKVISVLRRAGQGRTILSISHRLARALASQRIIRLEEGKISGEVLPKPR